MQNPAVIRKTLPILAAVIRWSVALLLLYFSSKIDEPLMYRYRSMWAIGFPLLTLFLVIRSYGSMRSKSSPLILRCEKGMLILVLLSAVFVVSYDATVFEYQRRVVLAAPEERLARLGRHFIVGYRNADEIRSLVEKQAIGGVYVTTRNIRGKSLEAVRRELVSFQSIVLDKGAPPLFVAADQEGGKVSRLSPLVRPMPPLSAMVRSDAGRGRVMEGVKAYAAAQAEQMTDIGINLNLSPVVDLKTDHLSHKLNFRSRIDQRAISSSAGTVTDVAATYCAVLLDHGIRPTLKHFPGLGSVLEDTHLRPGLLDRDKADLERYDWRPFKEVIARTEPFIMLGHVRVACIDPALPASLSPAVLTGMIRGEWQFDGVLITDDLNMGAISGRAEGIGRSAVRALNAGADLILLSYDGRQYYRAMYEMIKAEQEGMLNGAVLARSRQRLLAYRPQQPGMLPADRF